MNLLGKHGCVCACDKEIKFSQVTHSDTQNKVNQFQRMTIHRKGIELFTCDVNYGTIPYNFFRFRWISFLLNLKIAEIFFNYENFLFMIFRWYFNTKKNPTDTESELDNW